MHIFIKEKIRYILYILFVFEIFLSPEFLNASQNDEKTYFVVDTVQSYVHWKGTKLFGEHFGKVLLDSSWIEFEKGKLKSGKFFINMSTIICEDILDSTLNSKLVNHLKREDFFDVNHYPYAKLEIRRAIPNPMAKKNDPNYTIS